MSFCSTNCGGLVENLSGTLVAQQSATKTISLTFVNLVTPKARAKHEVLFNKPASANRYGFFECLSPT
jgi:hypothetical protein